MTVAEVRRIRRILYSLYLVALVTTLGLWHYGGLSSSQTRLIIGYGTLSLLDILGARYIRKATDLYPIYTVEKGFTGASFVLILLLGLGGYTQVYPGIAWTWIALLYGTKVVALEFILKKGIVQRPDVIHTDRGEQEVPDAETIDERLDEAAALLRHGYGSVKRRKGIWGALGFPANEHWTQELRDQHKWRSPQ